MTAREFVASVEVPVARPVAYAYLADPRNRPEWQSSLMSVSLPDRSEPHPGMAWRETTVVGVRPRMQITEMRPDEVWTEEGRWLGVSATLTLRFADGGAGTRVRAEGVVRGRGAWAVPAAVAGRLAGAAIGADLRRAAKVLARRQPPE